DIRVVLIVLPCDGEFFGTKPSRGPKNEDIDIVLGETINRLLPFGQSHHRHAHEGDIITPEFERLGALSADAQEQNDQKDHELHAVHLTGYLTPERPLNWRTSPAYAAALGCKNSNCRFGARPTPARPIEWSERDHRSRWP